MSRDARKPNNLCLNTTPIDGCVLAVDAKFKTRYDAASEAMTASSGLKQNLPVIQVSRP